MSIRPSDAEFFFNAKPQIFYAARKLRKKMTTAEKILWRELRGRKLNSLYFRRQHPISSFVVDFYCHEKRLVIELDGKVHNRNEIKERDISRTFELERFGLRVIRFTNEEVIKQLDNVIEEINRVCSVLTPP